MRTSLCKPTGYSFEELNKTPTVNLFENPQDRKTLLETLKRNGIVSDFSTRFKGKDNIVVDVILNVSKFKIGKKSFLRTTIQDVTDRKKAEETLDQTMDQLVLVNEKLGVVGSLTRHDVRNKLSAVTGYAYLIKKKHPDQLDIVEGLSKIETAIRDSMKIFEFAKMYEQLGAEERIQINVEEKLTEAITLFSGELPKIINECHGLFVLADSFLRQLFYNFIDNTRKYGKKTTTIKVHYEKAEGNCIKLIYEDDGVGIPVENKINLFHEGFSTGGSTGFGLFLTKKMIDVYGWQIQENGEPGKGAKFTITIPKLNQNGKENYNFT
jgi:PAS domain S-box-containing protein